MAADTTFPEHLLGLARHLQRLDQLTPDLSPAGATVAFRARSQCLGLVHRMLRSVGVPDPRAAFPSHGGPRREFATVIRIAATQIGTAPTVALAAFAEAEASIGAALHESAPVEAADESPYEAQWRATWRTAIQAGVALETLIDHSTPRQVDWTMVADAAAIATSIARLDQTLLTTAANIIPQTIQGEARTSIGRTHLAPAAAMTRELCRQQPRPPLSAATTWQTRPTDGTWQVVPIHQPSDLIAVQNRLVGMLRTENLEPRTLVALAATLARGVQLTQRVLPPEEHPEEHRHAIQLLHALAPVIENRHPQLEPPALHTPPSVPLLDQLDHLSRFIERASFDLDSRPELAAHLLEPTRQFLARTPLLVRESLATLIRHTNDHQWLTTVGPGTGSAEPHTNQHRNRPRLMATLIDATRTAWRIEQDQGGQPPTLTLADASRACRTDPTTITDRAHTLTASGATAGSASATWAIPATALLAAGFTPQPAPPDDSLLTLTEAAELCAVDKGTLRRHAAQLIAAGAAAPHTAHATASWQIPTTALLAAGFVPDLRYAWDPTPERPPRPVNTPTHAHTLLSAMPAASAPARVTDLPNRPLIGARESTDHLQGLASRLRTDEGNARQPQEALLPPSPNPLDMLAPPPPSQLTGPSL